MDIVGGVRAIIDVAALIYEQAKLVDCNRQQCKRLAERIQTIATSVNKLIEATSDKKALAKTYAKPLEDFKHTLDDALTLVTSFSDKSWLRKVVRAQSHETKFKRIYQRLEEDMQQLNLGLMVKQVLCHDDDIKDRKADYEDLLARQNEIIKVNQEAIALTQQLALEGAKRHQVLADQLASIQYTLARLAPEQDDKKASGINPKLLVPFFDLAIDGLLAEGSFGQVYLGKYLGQPVAIKLIDRTLTADERTQFRREVRILQDLRSDYIIPLYAVCDEPSRTCIVMKYMAHGSLRSALNAKNEHKLIVEQRHQIVLDIALGLRYLHHQEIYHQDLRSDNVFLDHECRARLVNFGLGR